MPPPRTDSMVTHPPSRRHRLLVSSAYFLMVLVLVWMADQPRFKSVFALVQHFPWGDKGAHFFLIGGLGFACNYMLRCRTRKFFGQPFLVGSAAALVLAIIEEFSQIFICRRVFDINDLGSAAMGILISGFLTDRMFRHGWIKIPPA